MSEESYIVNEGKNEIIEVDGVKYQRLAIRTHVITDKDDVCDVIEKYAKPYAKPDDIVFMTEKAVACTQGLHTAAAVAASLNPYAVLARGYTMVADARGRCLTTEHLKPGQKITVIGSNAAAQCTVDAVAPTQGNPEKEQTDEST